MDPTLPFQTSADIEAFIEAFRAERLPKARWTHGGHLVAGLWHVLRYGPEQGLVELRERIWAHNASVGTLNTDSEGYHETITRFYVIALAQAVEGWPGMAPEAVAAKTAGSFPAPPVGVYHAVLRSELMDSRIPLRFYRKETLFSVGARRSWVEPDLGEIVIEPVV